MERDEKGANEYPPEVCQRVVEQFEGIIDELWGGFRDIRKIRTRNDIFASLYHYLGRAFGSCLLFMADPLPFNAKEAQVRRFRILRWRRGASTRRRLPKWASGFDSKALTAALTGRRPMFFGPREFRHRDADPLFRFLSDVEAVPNLAVVPI